MDFIPAPGVLAAFVLASAILTVTPGPDMAFYLSRTLSQGRRSGLVALSGAVTGLVAHTLLAAFGISALLVASAQAFNLLKIVGALYLLWLAITMVRDGSALSVPDTPTDVPGSGRLFLSGLGINLLNPKIILFFLTFLPQFVEAGDPTARGKLMFLGLFFIVIGWLGSALIILAADRFSAAIRGNSRAKRALDYAFAAVMAAFAVRLLAKNPA